METRVSSHGINTLLLQNHPEKSPTWLPIASWGHCLELLEKLESHILLELKELHECAWNMGKFITFSQHLDIQVMLELYNLLKVMLKAYPKLQAMLIDIQQPTWLVGGASTMH